LLFHAAFVLLFVSTGGLWYVTRSYGPTMKWPHGTGRNHLGLCGSSTHKLEDLLVNETLTKAQVKEVVETHGAAIFQSFLTKQAAQNLFDYAMVANNELESLCTFIVQILVATMPCLRIRIKKEIYS
jgi:hypothetical protein